MRQRKSLSNFYNSGLVASTYDALTNQANSQIAGDIEFYLRYARKFGGPILELGVGTGRVAWPLVDAGFEVFGLDLSDEMLAIARRKGGEKDPDTSNRLHLLKQNISDFNLNKRFSYAIIPFTTFQHLTTPIQQLSCLKSIHRHLELGGSLIIDGFDPILDKCVPDAETPNPIREAIDPLTGRKIRRRSLERVNDPLNQTFRETFRIEVFDSQASSEAIESADSTHHLRWTLRQEMIYLFEKANFEVISQFSDFDESDPAYGKRQIWIARAF